MLEVEPIDQRGHTAPENGNKVVADTAPEAFARWLHNRNAPIELLDTGCSYECPDVAWSVCLSDPGRRTVFGEFQAKISPPVATIFRSFSGNETSNWRGDWVAKRQHT